MALPPLSTVIVSAILPVPDAVQVDPAVAAQLHVAPDKMTGSVSVTVAAVAVDGPLFDTTIV